MMVKDPPREPVADKTFGQGLDGFWLLMATIAMLAGIMTPHGWLKFVGKAFYHLLEGAAAIRG